MALDVDALCVVPSFFFFFFFLLSAYVLRCFAVFTFHGKFYPLSHVP